MRSAGETETRGRARQEWPRGRPAASSVAFARTEFNARLVRRCAGQRHENPSPLYAAATRGDADEVVRWISVGWDVDGGAPLTSPPLVAASLGGHKAAVKALLTAGAEPSRPSPVLAERTALHFAAAAGDVDLVSLLVRAGASLTHSAIDFGTPLDCAAECGHREVCELLVAAEAPLKGTLRGGQPRNGLCTVDSKSGPLHRASARGDREVCAWLLDHGADVDAIDRHGATPLHFAAAEGRVEVICLLISRGATVDLPGEVGVPPSSREKSWTWFEGTPLQVAVQRHRHEAARTLVEAGANTTSLNRGGKSALRLAEESKDERMIAIVKAPTRR